MQCQPKFVKKKLKQIFVLDIRLYICNWGYFGMRHVFRCFLWLYCARFLFMFREVHCWVVPARRGTMLWCRLSHHSGPFRYLLTVLWIFIQLVPIVKYGCLAQLAELFI